MTTSRKYSHSSSTPSPVIPVNGRLAPSAWKEEARKHWVVPETGAIKYGNSMVLHLGDLDTSLLEAHVRAGFARGGSTHTHPRAHQKTHVTMVVDSVVFRTLLACH